LAFVRGSDASIHATLRGASQKGQFPLDEEIRDGNTTSVYFARFPDISTNQLLAKLFDSTIGV